MSTEKPLAATSAPIADPQEEILEGVVPAPDNHEEGTPSSEEPNSPTDHDGSPHEKVTSDAETADVHPSDPAATEAVTHDGISASEENVEPSAMESAMQASELADTQTFDQKKKEQRTPPPRKTREERGLPPKGEEPTEEEPKGMTLMEHLSELRTRLVRSFIAVGLAFIVCYTFAEQLFAELCKPLIAALPEGSKLIFTALPEAFFVYVQVGLLAAVFVASPFLFYQIWSFISPGLYDEEKKYMIPMAVISAGFFIAGASFCFFMVFPYAFTFFVGFASEDIAAMPSLSEYLSFAMKLLIAFGLIFEMPLFTFFLARMGVITAALMRKVRKYAVLCSFIIAAILTPPDVISQLLMALPMMILYEMSIGVAAMFGRKKKQEEAETAQEEA